MSRAPGKSFFVSLIFLTLVGPLQAQTSGVLAFRGAIMVGSQSPSAPVVRHTEILRRAARPTDAPLLAYALTRSPGVSLLLETVTYQ